ncbi:hypothetical protein B0T13DRAFT_406981 [Neurospora crassa]|nr:hypothetical protein B0T13DRAFT_406981 [Neurospora crassa]
MSSGTGKPALQAKTGQGNFAPGMPSTQAILLDKLNRGSTPDSEALASSDDEVDPLRQEPPPTSTQAPKQPVRRASWLNDTSQPPPPPRQRKESFASTSMSPTTSHPSTPAVDSGVGAWGTHPAASAVHGRSHAGPSPFSTTWGAGIWTNERNNPPSRLAEVLPSPTSGIPPGSSGGSFFDNALAQQSVSSRDTVPNPQIPFPIPLHPTPKTYRSQSYSVGQLDPETSLPPVATSAVLGGRSRPLGHPGLQHRPSRPSMLSEMANDGSMLGKVNEDDDDDSTGSLQGASQQQSAEAKAIESLMRENAILRQQNQYQSSRLRPRASTSSVFGLGNAYLQEAVPEESDFAVDELDEANDGSDIGRRNLARRMSEFGVGPYRTPYMADHRKVDNTNLKRALWQTSLGFGGLGDIPQSRRHSFADVPVRQNSIASIGEGIAPHEIGPHDSAPDYASSGYSDAMALANAAQVQNYFTGGSSHALAQSAYGNQFPSPYSMLPNAYANRPNSPHRNMYGAAQPRHDQPLYIVLFKCARADVFYIQEGTGLTVKPGDLVIVEADRGTDLGTVAKDNVDWKTAKELKEHYAEEQYRWLMMYSQNAGMAQDGVGAGLMAASNLQGSAVGGMGPAGQHHIQEPTSGELKPKLIKRLAQAHEIHALREKEGNEAKAKRVCMQKVKEHGLNMEILDAEFQMDWKKLTFYYFADSYINFNSLVTDLFKIYKTRIWMSAINPASFASPTLGLQAPSGIGPGAVGVSRASAATERRQNTQQQDQQSVYTAAGQTGRNIQGGFPGAFTPDRAMVLGSGYSLQTYPWNSYVPFGAASRPGPGPGLGGLSYAVPGMMPNSDTYTAGGFPPAVDYSARSRFPTPQASSGQHEQIGSAQGAQADWATAFQGLSLKSNPR